MREPVRDKERLQHILDAINILEESRKKHDSAESEKDPIVYYGFVKHVEIIGEAVYMLSKEFKESHPEVEWGAIEGMRHVLVHGYYLSRGISSANKNPLKISEFYVNGVSSANKTLYVVRNVRRVFL